MVALLSQREKHLASTPCAHTCRQALDKHQRLQRVEHNCHIATYIPERFYNSGEPISIDTINDALVGRRRLRGLQEGTYAEATSVEIAGFNTRIKIDRPIFLCWHETWKWRRFHRV
jgi:hypothetical protein